MRDLFVQQGVSAERIWEQVESVFGCVQHFPCAAFYVLHMHCLRYMNTLAKHSSNGKVALAFGNDKLLPLADHGAHYNMFACKRPHLYKSNATGEAIVIKTHLTPTVDGQNRAPLVLSPLHPRFQC